MGHAHKQAALIVGTAKGVRPLPARPLGWQDRAACRDTPLHWWFPVAVGQGVTARTRAICDTCPVRAECLAFALGEPGERPEWGIWAGTTEDERRIMRRRRASRANAARLAAGRLAAGQ